MTGQNLLEHIPESRLHEYLDGALSPTEKAWVQGHLEGCPACQGDLQKIRAFFSRIEDLPDARLQIDLTTGVVTALKIQERTWLSGRWLATLQVGIAAAVLVFSWPFLLPGTGVSPFAGFTVQFELWLSTFQDSMAMNWAVWSIWADTLLRQTVDLFQRPAASLLPGFEIWPWAVALGLCWLLVNGYLLRPGDESGLTRQRNGGLKHKN
jgi:predicted anti-sigma-YlaC factor YlaD